MCNFPVPAGMKSCSPSPPIWKGRPIGWYRRERSCVLRSSSIFKATFVLAIVQGKRQNSALHGQVGRFQMRACLQPFLQLRLLLSCVTQRWHAPAIETVRTVPALLKCLNTQIQPGRSEKRSGQKGAQAATTALPHGTFTGLGLPSRLIPREGSPPIQCI